MGQARLYAYDLNAILNWLGTPSTKTLNGGYIDVEYEQYQLRFNFDQSKMLAIMSTENPAYRTREGIGVGSSIVDAKDIFPYGTIKKDGVYDCYEQGITFLYNKDTGAVYCIMIFPPMKVSSSKTVKFDAVEEFKKLFK